VGSRRVPHEKRQQECTRRTGAHHDDGPGWATPTRFRPARLAE